MAKDEYEAVLERLQSNKTAPVVAEPDEYDIALEKIGKGKEKVQRAEGAARLEIIPQSLATGTLSLMDFPGQMNSLMGMVPGLRVSEEERAELAKAQAEFGIPGMARMGDAIANPGRVIGNALGVGMEHHPELAPENAWERYGSTALAAIPSAIPMIMTGGISSIPLATGTAIAGGVSAQAGKDLFPGSTWAPLVFGVLGSLGAGWASTGLQSWSAGRAAVKEFQAAEREAAAAAKAVTDFQNPKNRIKPAGLVEAENRLLAAKNAEFEANNSGTLPGQTENELGLVAKQDQQFAGRRQAEVVANQVKAASRAELEATRKLGDEAVETVNKAAGETFTNTANSIGKAATLDEAGDVLQSGARKWVEQTLPKKLAVVSELLDTALPKTTPASVDNYLAVLEKMNYRDPALQGQLDLLSSPLPKALAAERKAAQELEDLAGEVTSQAPTWGGVRALRTKLGDALANPTLIKGMSQSEIEALYSAITKDLASTAKQHGAGDLWDAFNKESTRLYSVRDGVMSKLISTKNEAKEIKVTPGEAANRMIGASRLGGTEAAILREELPEAANALASLQLRDPKAWGKLSPEARAALLPDQAAHRALDDMVAAQAKAGEAAKAEFKLATQKYNDTVTAANEGAKTGNFSRSLTVREQQKVVEAERRQVAEQAAQADAARARELKAAQEAAKAEREAAAQALKQQRHDLKIARDEAKEAAKVAKAKLPPKANPADNLANKIDRLGRAALGGAAGYNFLPQLSNHLGFPMSPEMGAALGMTTLAAPLIGQGIKAGVTNPRLLSIPYSGYLAGENALAIPTPQR